MAIPVCSDAGCITQKYAFCGPGIPTISGGPCATELIFDFPDGAANPGAFAAGDNSLSAFAIPSSGLPACSTGPFSSATTRTAGTNPRTTSGVTPLTEVLAANSTGVAACGSKVGTCPSCIFVDLGPNLCDASNPNIVQFTTEEMFAVYLTGQSCQRAWVVHLSCPWKGRVCVSFCCDDPTG